MSLSIVYWSGTGNTAAMAQAVADGVKAAGEEAVLVEVGSANAAELLKADKFALGCPSMGAEELEESEMEPFMQELESSLSGKKVLLFGSYGWGDGEWMRNWVDRVTASGAEVIGSEGVIANETPDTDAVVACSAAGKALAEA